MTAVLNPLKREASEPLGADYPRPALGLDATQSQAPEQLRALLDYPRPSLGLDATQSEAPKSLRALLDHYRPPLELYERIREHLHASPELSRLEEGTAHLLTSHLFILESYKVTTNIGGYGVVAVLKNGPGPTVLLRADMDALPVKEQTRLHFASKVVMEDCSGVFQPVMHACGHDMHISCLLAAAETLKKMREEWSGTLVLVFQPDEEMSGGAQRMVDDGLFNLFPIPDVVLGQHVMPGRAGRLGMRSGATMAASDSMQVTFHGRGGHASMPQQTIDPVVMAAHAIVRLQTIVSRETEPGKETVVITVGKLTAGTADNIIADTAEMTVNVRTTDAASRTRVLASIRRIVKAESDASGAPKEPTVTMLSTSPVTSNDPHVTQQISKKFASVYGNDFDPDLPKVNGSEDFSVLAAAVGKPSCFWFVSATDPDLWDRAERDGTINEDVPANHSPFFAPVTDPTLKIGADALTIGALTFLRSTKVERG